MSDDEAYAMINESARANIAAFDEIAQRVLNDGPFDDAARHALEALRSEHEMLERGLTARGVLFCTPFDVELPTPEDAALVEIDALRAALAALTAERDRLREELHYAAVALDIERAETDRLRLAELEARAERDAALASLTAEREQNKRLREAAQEWAVLVVENHGVETILTGYEHRLLAAVVALDAGAATGGEDGGG